ncbi:sensor histidine kinase [Flavobacterium sp.]|uniref:sensor histidine kinase n=1 Tax=Flavobacterium sp. TaxID=239 RepID=UPI0026267663|nr:sensor histidine kinase [Flavobacterium sp.]
MERPKQFRIKIIFIAAIILLLSLSVFSYYRIDALINSSDRLNHTNVVKLELESVFSRVKDADADQRGFVLTKDSTYLKQFDKSLKDIRSKIIRLKAFTKDNYSQQRNLALLEKLIDKRIAHMKGVIDDAPNMTIPTTRWLEARGIMAEINQQITKMRNEESFLLRLRTKSLVKETSFTPIFTIFLTICSLIVVAVAYYVIHQELNISNELKANLETKKKQLLDANQSLEENIESLSKVNKELEAFTYISSHDLQEPLRKIQMMISRILEVESSNLSENGKNYLNRTHESANRMQTLIMDLLAYSRVKTEEFTLENIQLNQIVAEVKNDLEEEIAASHAVITLVGDTEIKAIASQFRQLLTNLISNAIKFSNAETAPEITIESHVVSAHEVPFVNPSGRDFSKITIADNGIGFDAQYQKRIFELFQRLHTSKEYPGTGIGLAIVKKIVENHQGFITAESPEGQGATFTIYLPLT